MQVLRSTLAFFAEHLGASAAERYPRPAIDDRRMAALEKLITPSGKCKGVASLLLVCGEVLGLMLLTMPCWKKMCRTGWSGIGASTVLQD